MAIGIAGTGWAQQTRQTNMYGFNKYGLNPAYAGVSGCTEVNFSHLNQWINVVGAPTTNFLSANTRVGQRWGIGGEMILDRAGLMRQFSTLAGGSYGFKIGRDHQIRLGLSGGFLHVQVDPNDATYFDTGDQLVESGVQSAFAFNSAAGVLYQFKGLELSFASQQFLETRMTANYPTFSGYALKRHLTGYGSYDIVLGKSYVLKPNLMYKGAGTTHQLDINADLNYNDFIYGGIGFRTSVGIVGRVGVNVRKLFFIGYAYEVPMQNIAGHGVGSHEIALALKFCKAEKKDIVDIAVDPVIDTVTIVEHVTDTVMIERIDTVFVEKPEVVSDRQMREAAFNAESTLEFEFDKAIIKKSSYGNLEALVNMMLIREDVTINLAGHTDNQGTEQYNMKLSRDRVESVKSFLVASGVDPSRVKTEYFGESKPIADNSTEEGRQKNRRVEMKIVK